jgi:hypothetical protein
VDEGESDSTEGAKEAMLDYTGAAYWQLAEPLADIARECAGEGRPDRARRLWSVAIEVARRGEASPFAADGIDCGSVLWEISEDLALAGEWQWAGEIAQAIKHPHKRQRALDNLANLRSGGLGSFQRIRDENL